MSDLQCPYCDAGLEVNHDDGFGYEEHRHHEMECSECEKNFVFTTAISFTYSPEKADCLNGSSHRFTEWREVWSSSDLKLQDRRCKDCDLREKRQISNGEEEP